MAIQPGAVSVRGDRNDEGRPPAGAAPASITNDNPSVRDQLRVCCDQLGLDWLVFDDGARRACSEHATKQDRELVALLDERAPNAGLRRNPGPARWGARLHWPYGPNIDVNARGRMLDWAEGQGLRLARPDHVCVPWITDGRCYRRRCERYRAAQGRGWWLDHVSAWSRGGRPALLLAQPYQLAPEDITGLELLDADPEMTVVLGASGWYGHGTYSVEVWRTEELAASEFDLSTVLAALRQRQPEPVA